MYGRRFGEKQLDMELVDNKEFMIQQRKRMIYHDPVSREIRLDLEERVTENPAYDGHT